MELGTNVQYLHVTVVTDLFVLYCHVAHWLAQPITGINVAIQALQLSFISNLILQAILK